MQRVGQGRGNARAVESLRQQEGQGRGSARAVGVLRQQERCKAQGFWRRGRRYGRRPRGKGGQRG